MNGHPVRVGSSRSGAGKCFLACLVRLGLLAALPLAGACVQVEPKAAVESLGGTSWRLVRFEGGDGKVLTPDDPAKYTIAFGTDGGVSARIDCNRGRGTWKSPEPGRLEFGPLALTRALCPPGSLHDHVTRQWSFVRSYVIRDARLYLSLMADGGVFEYEKVE